MVRFGILGLGNIANRVAKGINYAKNAELYAVCSRSLDNANVYKEKYGAQVAYGSYEELCLDEKVDVIYICTPNHLHIEQLELCFKHKKNVICEKPMVRSQEEVNYLFDLAQKNGCFLMEAHKTCFTPLNQLIKKRLVSGEFGEVKMILADYCYGYSMIYTLDSWVMHPQYGGCSYDVGVYPTAFITYMVDSDIKQVDGMPIRREGFECDFGMLTNIEFENGIKAQANCSWYHFSKNKGNALIVTTKGTIEIPAFWKSTTATITMDGVVEQLEVHMDSDFTGEVEEVASCIEKGLLESPTMGRKKSCDIMRVVESANTYRL